MILNEIVAKKKKQIEEEKKGISVEGFKQKMIRSGVKSSLNFFDAIKKAEGISLIAEVKKASPSKGVIREDFNPLEIAQGYHSAGADAISVLTERDYFMGDEKYLVDIRQYVPLPILRKDFIIDLWQVYQSKYLGADAILLITSILSDKELKKFRVVAEILGMHCIVEVHDENETFRALESGAKIVGINNRDLKTFDVDLRTTGKLMNLIPQDRAVVSESGIKTAEDIVRLRGCGADAVLIGETFMRSSSPSDKIKELFC